jgi:hypothetical protein
MTIWELEPAWEGDLLRLYTLEHENAEFCYLEVTGTVPDAPLPCSERVFIPLTRQDCLDLSIQLATLVMRPKVG